MSEPVPVPVPTAGRATEAALASRVQEAAAGLRAEMVGYLERLVRIETPSTEPATLTPAFDLLQQGLTDSGLRCVRRSGRTSGGMLLARWPATAGGPSQLLLGHCDTVWPVGSIETMPVRVEGGRMTGPGVYDMKGGLTQAIFALRVLGQLGIPPQVAPVVFINSDEEVGSRESERFIRRLARIVDRTFVLEPSLTPSGKLKTARKGVAQYHITVKGRAAHAGLNPEQGVSAILELSILVQRLFALNDPERGVSVNVGTIDGGMRPNVIAPESSARVDVRVPTRADSRRIDQAIRGLRPTHPEVELVIDGGAGRAPMERTPDSERLWRAAYRLGSDLGIELEQGTAGGGSDGNITCEYTPTLDGLGAVGDGAHALHEYVDLDRMVERTALLALLILQPPVARLEV